MNIRSIHKLILISMLASTWIMAQDQPGPPVTPNQGSPNLEKGLPPIPIITGGIAFNSIIEPNQTVMSPVVAPIILVPLGPHALIESEFEAKSKIGSAQESEELFD